MWLLEQCSHEKKKGRLLLVAYYIKKFSQRHYTVHDCKILAIVNTCSKWYYYLIKQDTIVFTDHKALEHLH